MSGAGSQKSSSPGRAEMPRSPPSLWQRSVGQSAFVIQDGGSAGNQTPVPLWSSRTAFPHTALFVVAGTLRPPALHSVCLVGSAGRAIAVCFESQGNTKFPSAVGRPPPAVGTALSSHLLCRAMLWEPNRCLLAVPFLKTGIPGLPARKTVVPPIPPSALLPPLPANRGAPESHPPKWAAVQVRGANLDGEQMSDRGDTISHLTTIRHGLSNFWRSHNGGHRSLARCGP